MGIFGSIWKAVKSVFQSVMQAIAKLFDKVFGSPLVASLAMFVIAFCIVVMFPPGGSVLGAFLESPVNFILSSPLLMAACVNVILSTFLTVFPEYSGFIGKVMGFVSFVLLACGVLSWYNGVGFFHTATWLSNVLGAWGIPASSVAYWWSFATYLSWMTFASGSSGDQGAAFVNAWVDGFVYIPGKVVSTIDKAASAASSWMWDIAIYGACGYALYRALSSAPQRVKGT